jgi:hypothetical protein
MDYSKVKAKSWARFRVAFCAIAMMLGTMQLLAQAPPSNGVSAHTVVTVEPRHGGTVPEIKQEDVMVYEGKERDAVTEWVPAQGENAALELFILLDDGASESLGSQLEDLRQFINNQPATTKVGVAYMQNGIARVVQDLTNDHAAAAKALPFPWACVAPTRALTSR